MGKKSSHAGRLFAPSSSWEFSISPLLKSDSSNKKGSRGKAEREETKKRKEAKKKLLLLRRDCLKKACVERETEAKQKLLFLYDEGERCRKKKRRPVSPVNTPDTEDKINDQDEWEVVESPPDPHKTTFVKRVLSLLWL